MSWRRKETPIILARMRRFVRMLARFAADRNGAAAILGAIVIVALLATAGLTLDLGSAYVQKARLQKVADSAAMAGALAWIKTHQTNPTQAATAAQDTIQSVVTANGLASSAIQNPTSAYLAQSPKNSANGAIQVQLSAPLSLTLLRVLVSASSVTTGAYAVAEINMNGATLWPACVLSLTGIIINSNSGISGSHCSVAANGTSNQAILLNSDTSIVVGDSINTPGGVYLNSNTSITAQYINAGLGVTNKGGHQQVTGTVNEQGVSAVADPFSSDQSVVANGFTNCQNYNNQTSITPGCWQNVNVNSNSSLSLTGGGTYYFQGSMNLNSNAILTATNPVTVVVQNQFSPSSNNTITLTAPSTNTAATPMPGIAIYAMGGININSNIIANINGAIYSPTAPIVWDSNTNNANNCTYVIGQSITFNSNVQLYYNNNCSSYSMPSTTGSGNPTAALVQ